MALTGNRGEARGYPRAFSCQNFAMQNAIQVPASLMSGDFNLESAEVGMEILANAVSDIDTRSLSKAEFGGSRGHIPANVQRVAAAPPILREFETEVALFHDARG